MDESLQAQFVVPMSERQNVFINFYVSSPTSLSSCLIHRLGMT